MREITVEKTPHGGGGDDGRIRYVSLENRHVMLIAIDIDLLKIIIRQHPYYKCTFYTCAVNGLHGSGM